MSDYCFACKRYMPQGMERNISKTFGVEFCNNCFETGRHARVARRLQEDINKTILSVNYHLPPPTPGSGIGPEFARERYRKAFEDLLLKQYRMDAPEGKAFAKGLADKIEIHRRA